MPNVPSTPGIYEWNAPLATWSPLSVREVVQNTLAGTLTVDLTKVSPAAPEPPFNLRLVSVAGTSINLSWSENFDTTVRGHRVYLNGVQRGADRAATALSASVTGLTAGTSYTVVVTRFNALGLESVNSNSIVATTTGTVAGVPSPPSTPTRTALTDTSVSLSWAETADATVLRHWLYLDGTRRGAALAAGATSGTITGLTPGTAHTCYVTRENATGNSGPSPEVNFATTNSAVTTYALMGSSSSGEGAGGSDDWDGWRIYTRGELYQRSNQTGASKPLFIAYSEQGSPFSGSYASIKAHVVDELEAYYYTTTGAQSARWGIKLYWSNGNENSDKGMLAANNASNLALYLDSQRGLYDAVHTLNGDGARRYPAAYAGTNPTQEHERTGIVQWWLHPGAVYHDFVMWSMYPPGRGVNDPSLSRNPRLDWPSVLESERNNIRRGFLTRCFYRTKQAENYARANGKPNHKLDMGCGETGQASDPDDRSARPYYSVHAIAYTQHQLAGIYNLDFVFDCWWDNKTAEDKPHNVLLDEPPNSDHLSFGTGAAAGSNAVATNPSTMQAWKNWRLYDKRIVGAGNLPAQWAGNPKVSWNNDGTPV